MSILYTMDDHVDPSMVMTKKQLRKTKKTIMKRIHSKTPSIVNAFVRKYKRRYKRFPSSDDLRQHLERRIDSYLVSNYRNFMCTFYVQFNMSESSSPHLIVAPLELSYLGLVVDE